MKTIQQQFLEKAIDHLTPEQREMFEHGYKSALEVLRLGGGDGPTFARIGRGFLETYKDMEVMEPEE